MCSFQRAQASVLCSPVLTSLNHAFVLFIWCTLVDRPPMLRDLICFSFLKELSFHLLVIKFGRGRENIRKNGSFIFGLYCSLGMLEPQLLKQSLLQSMKGWRFPRSAWWKYSVLVELPPFLLLFLPFFFPHHPPCLPPLASLFLQIFFLCHSPGNEKHFALLVTEAENSREEEVYSQYAQLMFTIPRLQKTCFWVCVPESHSPLHTKCSNSKPRRGYLEQYLQTSVAINTLFILCGIGNA